MRPGARVAGQLQRRERQAGADGPDPVDRLGRQIGEAIREQATGGTLRRAVPAAPGRRFPGTTRLSATSRSGSVADRPVREHDQHRLGHRAAGEVVQQPQRRVVGLVHVVDDDQQPVTGCGEPDQLGGRDEQPLMARLAGPADLAAGQRPFDLEAVHVVQAVEERVMLAAQVVQRLQDRRVGPGSLDCRCGAATGSPAAPGGQPLRKFEDGGLTHAGRAGEQQRAAATARRLVETLADQVPHIASAEEPAVLRRRPAAGALLELRAQRPRLGARDGAEFPAQRLVHPLELPQRAPDVTAVGAGPHEGKVGLLVGRVLAEHVLPALRESQQIQVQDSHAITGVLGPGLVDVLRQQRTAVHGQCSDRSLRSAFQQRPLAEAAELFGVDLNVVA